MAGSGRVPAGWLRQAVGPWVGSPLMGKVCEQGLPSPLVPGHWGWAAALWEHSWDSPACALPQPPCSLSCGAARLAPT